MEGEEEEAGGLYGAEADRGKIKPHQQRAPHARDPQQPDQLERPRWLNGAGHVQVAAEGRGAGAGARAGGGGGGVAAEGADYGPVEPAEGDAG